MVLKGVPNFLHAAPRFSNDPCSVISSEELSDDDELVDDDDELADIFRLLFLKMRFGVKMVAQPHSHVRFIKLKLVNKF